jgi:GNAT superfamily N-acetyltransferase
MWDVLNNFDRNRFSGSNMLSFDPALSDAAVDWWRDHIYAQHGLYPDDLGELLSASATGGKVITIADLDPNVGSFVVRIKGFPSDSGEAWWTQRKLDLSGPLFEAQRMLIPSGDRQQGKGRMLMADLVDTAARFGIHTITIEAQDIGRYAWARFGFVPDRTAWMRSVRVEARRRLKMANAEISPTAMVAYGEILDGENPKLIREVASWRYPVTSIVKFNKDTGLPEKVPLGQALLLETQEQWYGTFDLGDPETMEIFERYVGRS